MALEKEREREKKKKSMSDALQELESMIKDGEGKNMVAQSEPFCDWRFNHSLVWKKPGFERIPPRLRGHSLVRHTKNVDKTENKEGNKESHVPEESPWIFQQVLASSVPYDRYIPPGEIISVHAEDDDEE